MNETANSETNKVNMQSPDMQSGGDVPLLVPTVAWLHASGGISVRAGQFPAPTVAAVSLFSIMAKDKGNLLCLRICNKQPLMMNEAVQNFKGYDLLLN